MSHLHITNGDIFADKLVALGIAENPLPWRDVLHEGPVPGDLTLEVLSTYRIDYIAREGWAPAEEVNYAFQHRDQRFKRALRDAGFTLWFEDDLYDQLQLLQVLNELAQHPEAVQRTRLVQAEQNLADYSDDEIIAMEKTADSISSAMLAEARTLWEAFTAPTPQKLNAIVAASFDGLPLAHEALLRFMEEYPSKRNGLSKVENMLLRILSKGPASPRELFVEYSRTEKRRFLGDIVLMSYLGRLDSEAVPLLEFLEKFTENDPAPLRHWMRPLRITVQGERVHAGEIHLLKLQKIDRWMGGTRVQVGRSAWVFNEATRQIEEFEV